MHAYRNCIKDRNFEIILSKIFQVQAQINCADLTRDHAEHLQNSSIIALPR